MTGRAAPRWLVVAENTSSVALDRCIGRSKIDICALWLRSANEAHVHKQIPTGAQLTDRGLSLKLSTELIGLLSLRLRASRKLQVQFPVR